MIWTWFFADAAKGQEVFCAVEPIDNEEAALQWFDHIPVDHAPFIFAHQSCLLEGIAAGITYMNRMIAKYLTDFPQIEKHFIIVGMKIFRIKNKKKIFTKLN